MGVRTITKEVLLPYPPATVWAFLLTEGEWQNWWYDLSVLARVDPGWELGATMYFGAEWAPTIKELVAPSCLAFGGHRLELIEEDPGKTLFRWSNSRRRLAVDEFDPMFEVDQEVERELAHEMELAVEELMDALADFDPERQEVADAASHPTLIPDPTLLPDSTPRELRVFVSSTFKDLQTERDELSKRTFIELRRICEERGVAWTDVDLRWGITDEQKAEGKVLPICLEEIDNCRPYFIGILGERYGWVPDELPKEQVDRIPWLAEGRGRSVTEMEIVHGVLNDPNMAAHAFFYFRDPDYIQGLPPDERAAHLEGPTPEEAQELGHWAAEERAAERRKRLAHLKARIQESGLAVRRFRNPRELAELVAQDLKGVVETRFPAKSSPGRRETSSLLHEGVIQEARSAFVPRPSITGRLDRHVKEDGPPLVITGESGSGKSALLANWIHEYRKGSPEEALIVHFIGASSESAAWDRMVGRLLDELGSVAKQGFQGPQEPQALRKMFARALHAAGARSPTVLVIDGLNELEDQDQALDLAWLPTKLPEGIKLILSTLPGPSLDEVKRRGWPVVEVGPLEETERVHLIREYLARFRKSLSDEHLERILTKDPGGNPLFLRTMLEELRLHGDHGTLGDVIDHYTESPDLPNLFERVLTRLERDYEGDRPGLVGEALTLILAAKKGLSEDEMLDLLGTGGERLPRALWSPLHLAAGHLVSNRSGLLGLRHDQLKEAVSVRYLAAEADRPATHGRLADYFQDREWGPRRTEELPWQLARSEAWTELADLLGDLDFLDAAWQGSGSDVRRYWTQIEERSDRRLAHQYQEAIASPDSHEKGSWELASLLGSMGHPDQAQIIQKAIAQEARTKGDKANLMASLGNQARYLRVQGRWQEAVHLFREQEALARELGHTVGLATALGGQAGIHRVTGAIDTALDLYQEEAELRRNAGDQAGLQYCLGNQALVLVEKADLDGALHLRMEQERLAREIGEMDGLRMALEAQSVIHRMTGKLDSALEKNQEAEVICRNLGDRSGLATTLINRGEILKGCGDGDGAMTLYQEAESICRAISERQDLAVAINNQAAIHLERGQVPEALKRFQECEEISRSLGYAMGLQAALGNQGQIALQAGETANALVFLEEQEGLCRDMGYPLGLAQCLNLKGTALNMNGRSAEAEATWEEARDLVERHGLRSG